MMEDETRELEDKLITAIRECDEALVSELLVQDIDPNCIDKDGNPALIIAVNYDQEGSHEGIVDALLDHPQIDVDSQDKNGNTALIYAVKKHNHALLEKLLAKSADTDAVDSDTKGTALHLAAGIGDVEATEILMNYGSDINETNAAGMKPLEVAINRVLGWNIKDQQSGEGVVSDEWAIKNDKIIGLLISGVDTYYLRKDQKKWPPIIVDLFNKKLEDNGAFERGYYWSTGDRRKNLKGKMDSMYLEERSAKRRKIDWER